MPEQSRVPELFKGHDASVLTCSHGPLQRAFPLIQTGPPSAGEVHTVTALAPHLHPVVQIRAECINKIEQIF